MYYIILYDDIIWWYEYYKYKYKWYDKVSDNDYDNWDDESMYEYMSE